VGGESLFESIGKGTVHLSEGIERGSAATAARRNSPPSAAGCKTKGIAMSRQCSYIQTDAHSVLADGPLHVLLG
jgi:hypothetical protein